MKKVFDVISRVASTDVAVLVTGESGTGKELVARAIHYNSLRSARGLHTLNCAAFQDSLLEAEMFGYVKGAFTGANRDKRGIFEVADQGSIFLDEIGETSPALQAKLLRVLQDGTFQSVGDIKTKQSDFRLICATHRDLQSMINEGLFRQDLFYRINVVRIELPPLRERTEDITALVEHFIELSCRKNKCKPKSFSAEAQNLLMSYPWPGNIRELQNEIERALVLSPPDSKVIEPTHLSSKMTTKHLKNSISFQGPLKETLEQVEREMISQALIDCKGNKSEVSRRLSISRTSLLQKVQQYGLAD